MPTAATLSARTRFAAEVVAAVRAAVSPDFPVNFRFSQWKGGAYDARLAQSPQELEQLLTPLADAGVDAFHASTRRYWLPEFDGSELNLAGWTKKLTGRPVISVGSVGLDKEFMGPEGMAFQPGTTGIEKLLDRLENDEFDMIAVGRSLIADPDWPSRITKGEQTNPFSAELLGSLNGRLRPGPRGPGRIQLTRSANSPRKSASVYSRGHPDRGCRTTKK